MPLANPVLIFSLILLIILLSPILLRRLNIPGIIGLIISGVIIGPYGLNILEKNSAVDLFSTIGLLYIMFIAGLELDMNEFRANRNKSLFFGFLTFIIPVAVVYPVCYYVLDYDVNASLLTAALLATHTLVAYPIVSKMGIAKNQAVAITVGGTILADTVALIILAVILGNHKGSLNQAFFIQLGISLTIFSFIIFFLIPKLAQWFFRKMESEKHAHYIFVLLIVFISAFLAEVAGVEAIIGAFMAGLAINRLIPPTSALMNRIEFIGSSLFIPFFLISVGMLVNVQVIFSGTAVLVVAATLSAMGLFGKWLSAWVAQKLFKYSRDQRNLIFGLSSARAAATLAIVLVGFEAGILGENILNGTVILILVTCIVGSIITEKAAKKVVIATENEKPDEEQNGKKNTEHILLPIANIDNIGQLLELAIYIKAPKSKNPVSVLSVVSNNSEAEANILKARRKLEEFVKQASASETEVNVITTIDHNAASGISRIAREVMADIIVLGWPQRAGLIDKLIGQKVDNILNNTSKTAFICHVQKPLPLHKRMLVVVPPLAEREPGFELWMRKCIQLAQELTIPLLLYANSATEQAVRKFTQAAKVSIKIDFHYFEYWDDFMVMGKHIREHDLFVLVSARKGSTSFMNSLDKLPSKLERYFEKTSRLVIYPQQFGSNSYTPSFEAMDNTGLSKGMERLRRGLGELLKNKGSKPAEDGTKN